MTGMAMGSLIARAPAGMVTDSTPPKVTAWSVPVWVVAPPVLRAVCTLATVSGVGPNSLEMRRRIALPPRER